jgi:hypothetical protein
MLHRASDLNEFLGHRLGVLENRLLRGIFVSNRNKIVGEWRKLHNEELLNFYSS